MNTLKAAAVVTAVLGCCAVTAHSAVINVSAGGSIQAAINAAGPGDEIVAAAGTYFQTIDFLGKAITVRSADGPETTIIDAGGNGTVVSFESNEGSSSVLKGFTVRGGGGGGRGMTINGSNPTLINCIIADNIADNMDGGGIYNIGGASPTFINCLFTGNIARSGAAMCCDSSSPTVINCTFYGNAASDAGGGIFPDGSSPIIVNSVFWANQDCGGINASAQIETGVGTPLINSCCIQGWLSPGVNGNLNDNPLFVDELGGNLRLQSGSACNDSGNNSFVPVGQSSDLDGNVRITDDPAAKNSGVGKSPLVDMGAYEFQPTKAPACPEDCAAPANGQIDVIDLLQLLADWGNTSPCDVNGSGSVDVPDLLAILGAWGACP